MTQDVRWQAQYDQMMAFMKENHRRPSKHRLEEHDMLNWYKHTKKMIAQLSDNTVLSRGAEGSGTSSRPVTRCLTF